MVVLLRMRTSHWERYVDLDENSFHNTVENSIEKKVREENQQNELTLNLWS